MCLANEAENKEFLYAGHHVIDPLEICLHGTMFLKFAN